MKRPNFVLPILAGLSWILCPVSAPAAESPQTKDVRSVSTRGPRAVLSAEQRAQLEAKHALLLRNSIAAATIGAKAAPIVTIPDLVPGKTSLKEPSAVAAPMRAATSLAASPIDGLLRALLGPERSVEAGLVKAGDRMLIGSTVRVLPAGARSAEVGR